MAGIEAEIKLSKFEKDIKNQTIFNKNLETWFLTEYDEIINDILNLKDNIFIDQVKEGVSLILEDLYTDYCLSEPRLVKLFNQNLEEIKSKYRHDFYLVNTAWNNYDKNIKKRMNKDSLLSGFRKHCIFTDANATHNCLSKEKDGEKNSHFIIVRNSDAKKEIKFVVCENCKKVYYSSFILARCYKCKVDYYTSLLTPEENPELLIATWENYHCAQLINEKMKCIKCHEVLYINMKTGLLTCLNKKCEFISKPNRILWTCCTCEKEFKSGAIPYNPLDILVTKRLVNQTLLLKHKAHPKKMICGCKVNIYFTDFFHNKNCDGILYESELDDNTIIVCDKCKGITYIDRFIWTCPKCNKRFKNGNDDNNNYLIDGDNINNPEEIHIHEKNEKYERNKIEENKKDNGVKKHINYASKRLKNNKEKDKDKENDINKDIIEDKENNKEKKKNEVISGGWKHRRYNINHPNENNENQNNEKEKEKMKEIDINNSNNSNNIDNSNKELKDDKKFYRRFRFRDKVNTEEKIKEKENNEKLKDKEEKEDKEDKDNSDNENNNKQKYTSPRKIWKRRFKYHNSNNDLLEIEKLKKEKEEKEEKEEEERIQKEKDIEEEKKKSQSLKLEELKKEKENDEEDEQEENDLDKTLSDYSSSESDNDNIPINFNRNLLKKKTTGVVLGESGDIQPPDSPLKRKKKNAPQIQVKVAMSHIPGVSEHLFNHITKRMTSILNRCKIPVFNIEDYVFNKKLGQGGYAVIFSVFKKDDENQKQFALKKIIAKTLTEIDKFTKEFEIMHNCIHENIMKIYGICIRILDQTTYALYVLMELSDHDWDKEIKHHLAKKKLYSEKKLIYILRQITSALLFMQQNAKISHRDIKPQNILRFGDIYKIADFGEAKQANSNSEVNTLRGTELFMSPVLYSGLKHDKNDVNHDPYKSDVFSLGFCFLYAATLNFDILYKVRGIYNSNIMDKIVDENLKGKYSDTFLSILKKMLDTDEKERFSFTELVKYVDDNYDKEGHLKNENDNGINKINNESNNSGINNRSKKFKK